MGNKRLKISFSIFIIVALIITSFSALVSIYEDRNKIVRFFQTNNYLAGIEEIDQEDIYWAKKIMNGGFILHFRHAERDKWLDLGMYDALESDVHKNGLNDSRYAENEYFEGAVCLNKRGKVQARAIGEQISNIGLRIGTVASSVSCRARQTAELAFGGYDSLHRILVHAGPYNEDLKERLVKLKNFYSELPIVEGKNTIVSSHNSVINCKMFINDCLPGIILEEGGFYVISQQEGGLVLEHEFHTFTDFNRVFYNR